MDAKYLPLAGWVWWFTFMLSSVSAWTITLLLFVLIYGAVLYCQVALLFPDDFGREDDAFQRFIERRHSFFSVFLALGVVDVADTLVKVEIYELRGPPLVPYVLLMVAWFSLGIASLKIESRIFHQVFAYVWLMIILAWSISTLTV